jgi:hypothetical protein
MITVLTDSSTKNVGVWSEILISPTFFCTRISFEYSLLGLCWCSNWLLYVIFNSESPDSNFNWIMQEKYGDLDRNTLFWPFLASIPCWYLPLYLYRPSSWLCWMHNLILYPTLPISRPTQVEKRILERQQWQNSSQAEFKNFVYKYFSSY